MALLTQFVGSHLAGMCTATTEADRQAARKAFDPDRNGPGLRVCRPQLQKPISTGETPNDSWKKTKRVANMLHPCPKNIAILSLLSMGA